MTITAATDCPMCGEVVPPGRNLYCSPRCRERAKKQRQRARAAGSDGPVPTPRPAPRLPPRPSGRGAAGRARGRAARDGATGGRARGAAPAGGEGSKGPQPRADGPARARAGDPVPGGRVRPDSGRPRSHRTGPHSDPRAPVAVASGEGEPVALNITRISSVEYLQSTVMVGDAKASTSITGRGLTAYYTESGN